MNTKKTISLLLALLMVLGMFANSGIVLNVKAAEPSATLTVDLDPAKNTGEILHGAAGFLYGVSSEDVPTTNTIVPLKSKILCTKGAVGTEHPYGDALDVAKTFLESGGQQVMMYNSNYYGVFGVTATIEQYSSDLKNYICPAVKAWKAAWKEEHGTPDEPKDGIGKVIDIDEALCYIPINEGTPQGDNFYEAWESFYKAIKEADPGASVVGPNSSWYYGNYSAGQDNAGFLQFCADHDCVPDIFTWHELADPGSLSALQGDMEDFKRLWNATNWTTYNEVHGTSGIPEVPQICINEYGGMTGVPGRLVNWISRFEDAKITGCLPFWHQANNLNDLTAGANEGNGAWWLYQWYGNMSGKTQPVESTTTYDLLYGVSTMDEAKKISTTLLGGYTGDITVKLNNIKKTEAFRNSDWVSVNVQEASYTGFHGAALKTPTIIKGTFPVDADGSVTIKIPGALFENAYNVTVTQPSKEDLATKGLILVGSSGDVYEAEHAALSGTAVVEKPGDYHMSNDEAVNMPTDAVLTYTIDVPTDGKYKLEFLYGNGQGTQRNNMRSHDPVNVTQTFRLDQEEAKSVTMESTLWQTMCGTKSLYYDLKAGQHTVTVTTTSQVDNDMVYHDCVRVSYAGVYGKDIPAFNTVYEAELADFNKLLDNTASTVTTETDDSDYSGGGYVTGLSGKTVPEGGGIRYTVVVDESGLYNLSLRYRSESAADARIYVGNTAATLNRLNKTIALAAGSNWQTATGSVYLQKGIKVVDVDATADIDLDYLRVRALDKQTNSETIEAEDAIPAELQEFIQVAESSGASGGKYVVGLPGAYETPDYLEFHYEADKAGKYQLQVFHSNEDLAGSHSYNIKTTDKYAVFEVNGKSQSPEFDVLYAGNDGGETASFYNRVVYFVDAGDHDPSTVSKGDVFGEYNTLTEQIYGKDPQTEYYWGLVPLNGDDHVLDWTAGSAAQSENDKAVYTTYQRALSNADIDLQDGKDKQDSYRYGHGQDSANPPIEPRRISYKFELEQKEYEVTVGTSGAWGNANNPKVTLTANGVGEVSETYSGSSNQIHSQIIDLSKATTNERGKVELSVDITTTDSTVAVNFITIADRVPFYFVDCGDHDPSTVSEGDELGMLNSVTDRHYGEADKSGYNWGVAIEPEGEAKGERIMTVLEALNQKGHEGHPDCAEKDKAVYTTYQRANANGDPDLEDGKPKTETFRYANDQDLETRYLCYKFELPRGVYDVTVCMGNIWGNSGNPTVTLSADGAKSVSQNYTAENQQNDVKTQTIDLSHAKVNRAGRVELSVKATSSTDATLNMNYITILGSEQEPEAVEGTALPGGTVVSSENLPQEGIYLGKLTAEEPWLIDYRNLKNETNRYFFINTFSDDTFREKTITLNLNEGDNVIRIYNDNSWNVTYGGTQSTPATEWLRNYTPNFDKFVITPMALDSPVAQDEAYNINVSAGQGGTAVANENTVALNGSYTLTIQATEGLNVKVFINGADRSDDITGADGVYTLTVNGVQADQNISVFFVADKDALQKLVDEFNTLNEKDYTADSWAAVKAAAEEAKRVLEDENASAGEIDSAYNALRDALAALVERDSTLVYFVDCGDHDPSTLTGTDQFGRNNSVTDQHYDADQETGYSWGLVIEPEGREKGEEIMSVADAMADKDHADYADKDKAVYTTYQRALANTIEDLADGQPKTRSCRYANGQDGAGINPRYIAYRFELDPGKYEVTVCMGNVWSNSRNSTVTLSADSVESVSEDYTAEHGQNDVKTQTINLSSAKRNAAGRVELLVKANSTDPTINMNYIVIHEVEVCEHPTTELRDKKEPTCTEPGYTGDTYCTVCGELLEKGEQIEATGHTEEVRDAIEATCVQTGYTGNTYCTVCKELLKVGTTVPASGHSWDNGKVTTAPTCEGAGIRTYTCETCGETRVEAISAAGHTAQDVPAVAATCTKPGSTAGKKCSVCGAILEGLEVVPATGHTLVMDNAIAPTCTAAGKTAGVHCSVCNEVLLAQQVIAATGHNYTSVVTKEATETSEGEITYLCPNCGDSYTEATAKLSCPSEPFTDLNRNAWYHEAVDYVIQNELMLGTADDLFAPDGTFTRGQLVTVLYRMENSPSVEGLENPFTDVPDGKFYTDAVIWAADNGIVLGVGNQRFAPNDRITREQFATILYRYSGSEAVKDDCLHAFTDAAAVSGWAKDGTNWAVAVGLLNGVEKGRLDPTSDATRAQAAAILYRYLTNVESAK